MQFYRYIEYVHDMQGLYIVFIQPPVKDQNKKKSPINSYTHYNACARKTYTGVVNL